MEYGNTNDSLLNPPLADGAVQPDALCWLLNKVIDSANNYMTFTYFEDETTGESYPEKIEYTGNAAQSLIPYNSVEFVYEDRSDASIKYIAGKKTESTKWLKTVKSLKGTQLVRSRILTYDNQGAASRSRVTQFQTCDVSGDCVLPTLFEWKDEDIINGWQQDNA